ncbi:MAG: hypothetical protein H6832_19065, partial [Planctomycetes bacterium]|nr:hypothetical protein [Planctomycetota bacterium]
MIRSQSRMAWTAAVLLSATTPLATQSAVLTTQDATGPGLYGAAVAVDGDVALVGAPGDAIHGNNYTGSVLVYRRVQGSWQEEQKLTGSGGALLDSFGRSVAIQGNVAVVGAPATLSKTNLTGTVYIFRHNGTAWVEEAKFGRGAGCGTSVDIDGDRVIVGASATRLGGQNFTGAAWVFRYSSTSKTWSEEAQLVANDGVGSDWFG